MPTHHQLQQQLKADDDLVGFLPRKEIKELPRIMWKDEHVETIFYAHFRGCNGILVCTNARLIFADKGVHAFTTETVELDKVQSMESGMEGKFGKFTFVLPKKTVSFEYLDPKTFEKIDNWLKTKMSSPQAIAKISHEVSEEEPEEEKSPKEQDLFSKLERLAKLRDQGILTEREFQVEKQKLLGTDLSSSKVEEEDEEF